MGEQRTNETTLVAVTAYTYTEPQRALSFSYIRPILFANPDGTVPLMNELEIYVELVSSERDAFPADFLIGYPAIAPSLEDGWPSRPPFAAFREKGKGRGQAYVGTMTRIGESLFDQQLMVQTMKLIRRLIRLSPARGLGITDGMEMPERGHQGIYSTTIEVPLLT
jgi:hypothetical protein